MHLPRGRFRLSDSAIEAMFIEHGDWILLKLKSDPEHDTTASELLSYSYGIRDKVSRERQASVLGIPLPGVEMRGSKSN